MCLSVCFFRFRPHQNADPRSPRVAAVIDTLISFKNNDLGAWIRGGDIVIQSSGWDDSEAVMRLISCLEENCGCFWWKMIGAWRKEMLWCWQFVLGVCCNHNSLWWHHLLFPTKCTQFNYLNFGYIPNGSTMFDHFFSFIISHSMLSCWWNTLA